jgi:hypothetical protein
MRVPVAAACHYLIQALALNLIKIDPTVKEIEARQLAILEPLLGMHLSAVIYFNCRDSV